MRSTSAAARVRRFFGLAGIAIAPVAGDARRAGRRAAAEHGEAQAVATVQASSSAGCGILLNRRKKFAVVSAAISASLTPIVSASTAAVCAT